MSSSGSGFMLIESCHHIYCADVGSIKKRNFGWAGVSISPKEQQHSWRTGEGIQELVDEVADRLNKGTKVALGFECPLWVPVRDRPEELTSGRCGDGSRAWSFGAGAASLVTGLPECAWTLQKIREISPDAKAYLDWESFLESKDGLFIWEAFVSGGGKTGSHTGDAKVAVSAFIEALPSLESLNAVRPSEQTYSLIGAALLWAGWSTDPCLLHQPCKVMKVDKS